MSSVTVRQEIVVDVVADLATLDSVNFPKPVDGQTVKTRGYHSVGDGGDNVYIYRATGRTGETMDGGFYITGFDSDDYFEAIDKQIANVLKFGAKNDGSVDAYAEVENARTHGLTVYFPGRNDGTVATYQIFTALGEMRVGEQFVGDGRENVILRFGTLTEAEAGIILSHHVLIRDLSIHGRQAAGPDYDGVGVSDGGTEATRRFVLQNVGFEYLHTGIRTQWMWIGRFLDCYMVNCIIGHHHLLERIATSTFCNINGVYFIGGEIQACQTGVKIEGLVNQLTYENVVIEGMSGYGIHTTALVVSSVDERRDQLSIVNCYFEANDDIDILLDGVHYGARVLGNFFIRAIVDGPECIQIQNSNGNTRKCTIEQNNCLTNDGTNASIVIGSTVNETRIRNNMRNSGLDAIITDNGTGTIIE